ncbi:hypothetical protein ACP70R_004976 [Stipagrostis hirtigluma subsp. patula]
MKAAIDERSVGGRGGAASLADGGAAVHAAPTASKAPVAMIRGSLHCDLS